MRFRSTLSSGIVAALVALMLVASMTGSAAAAEQLAGGVNPDADAAHDAYIDGDVTKSIHQMGWAAVEYENNNGEVASLPAEINDSVTHPYNFEASEIETGAYGAFPRDEVRTEADGKAGAVRASGWVEDEAGTAGSGTISNVTTAPGVEAVEISTSSQTSGDNYRATFDAFKITSDAQKRYVQVVFDVKTLDAGADANVMFNDTDGDYVSFQIDPDDDASTGNTAANSTGDGYVFQQQVGTMNVSGTGDGTMDNINATTVGVSDGNAEIEIAALNVEKLGAWDFGDRREDTDSDDDNETVTVRDINESGDYGITDLSTMGSAFDAATIHDVTLPIQAHASMMELASRDTRFANITNATAFASFSKRVDDYRALKLPTAYDLSYSNLELRDEVAVPSNRYQTVEYATAVGDTDFANISDSSWTDVTSSYSSLGTEVTLATGLSAGEVVAVHYDYPITSGEYTALTKRSTPAGGAAPMADDGGGFFDSFVNRLMTGITGLLVALGLKRKSGGS